MSLIIDNSYKFKKSPSLQELQRFCSEFRDYARKSYFDDINNDLISSVCKLIDRDAFIIRGSIEPNAEDQKRLEDQKNSYLTLTVIDMFRDLEKDKSFGYNREVEFNVIPHKGEVYVSYFCGVSQIRDKIGDYLKHNDDLESFYYWESYYNNEDDEDDGNRVNKVNPEWEKRGEIWKDIFKDGLQSNEVGFNYRLLKDTDRNLSSSVDRLNVDNFNFDERFKSRIFNACQFAKDVDYEKFINPDGILNKSPSPSDYIRFIEHLSSGGCEAFNNQCDIAKDYLDKVIPEYLIRGTVEDVLIHYQKKVLEFEIPSENKHSSKRKMI